MMGGSVSVSRERERDVIRRAQLRGNMRNFCPQAPRDPAGFGIVGAAGCSSLVRIFAAPRDGAHPSCFVLRVFVCTLWCA